MTATTHHWLKPLRRQHQLTQWVLFASLLTGTTGLMVGIVGTAARVPSAILMGYSLIAPSALGATSAGWATRELRRRLAVATKDQAAINAQIQQAWQSGHEAGQTEALSQPPEPTPDPRVGELQTQLQTVRAQLNQAAQTHDAELQQQAQTITELTQRLKSVDQETQRLDALKHQLKTQAAQLENQKESQHHRELTLARGESQTELLRQQITDRDRRLDDLARQLTQLTEEYQAALVAEHTEGYEQGINHATAQHALALEKAQATIAKLQARLNQLNAYAAQDRTVPTLAQAMGKMPKPAFITAGQGAGKALHSAELCRIWSEGADSVCAFVLDISEGGSAASSWSRMGIPVTDDPDLFIQVMGAVVAKLDDKQSELPWRNNTDEYRAAPPIVLVIDEALTSFDGQTNGKIQAVIDSLSAIESRGSKRKVFCIACSTDDQIQNISATSSKGKTMKLWNTGRLRNYYRLYLNDGLLQRATDDELKSNPALKSYLDAYGGSHFVAALETIDGKGKRLKPFKHASHHGHTLTETKPSYAPELTLICPAWFPPSARVLFPSGATPQADVGDHSAATAAPHADLESALALPCAAHPQEGSAKTEDATECPHCHTVGRHSIHSRDKESGTVKRWRCKNKGCRKTFKNRDLP